MTRKEKGSTQLPQEIAEVNETNETDTVVINPTFLGSDQRNFYGLNAPDTLTIRWKHFLGSGFTVVNPKDGRVKWYGAGWTGQPLMVREGKELYLIQGAYDHNLKKINARTGKLVWQYTFDNVIKGTGSIWVNEKEKDPNKKWVILQGSRKNINKSLYETGIYSFRAISYFTGEELWRLPVKRGSSYSRDVDASAIVYNNKCYVPTENGYLTILDIMKLDTLLVGDTLTTFTPQIIKEIPLFDKNDRSHGGNIIPESSPLRVQDKLYICSGSGWVYGVDLKTDSLFWEYQIGADINGTPAYTNDGCLLVPVEKQYISGNGGVLKIQPGKSTPEWYLPTLAKGYASWKGGVVGSVIRFDYEQEEWMAFNAVDGKTYLSKTSTDTSAKVKGPNGNTLHPPENIIRLNASPSISTPLFVPPSRVYAATYEGLYAYEIKNDSTVDLIKKIKGGFEATPFVYGRQLYLASRDGFLYCWGDSTQESYVEEDLLVTIDSAESPPDDTVILVDNESDAVMDTAYSSRANPSEKHNVQLPERELPKADVHQKYHLIVGAFSVPSNAVGKHKQLIDEGYESAKLLPQIKGLDYVSIDYFESREQALKKQKELQEATWIYYYP